MYAFLTGSRIYGIPKPDSDIDLAILLDERAADILAGQADAKLKLGEVKDPNISGGTTARSGWSLRFGALNLLVFTDKNQFEAWRRGTADCLAIKQRIGPLTREQAVSTIEAAERLLCQHSWGIDP